MNKIFEYILNLNGLVLILLSCITLYPSTFYYSQANDVIIVSGQGLRETEPAYRIKGSPLLNDTTVLTKISEYPRLSLKHETEISTVPIVPGRLKTKNRNPKLYNGYAKVGIGSQITPIAELYFGSTRDKEHLYGAYVKHLSSFGKIRDYAPAQFDITNVGLFGSILKRKYSLSGKINYRTHGFKYYGWPQAPDKIQSIDLVQRYNNIGVSGKFESHKKDSANLNYSIELNYNKFNTKKPLEDSLFAWKAGENNLVAKNKFWYKYKNETFSTMLDIRYNGFLYGIADSSISANDSGYVLNNTIIALKPNVNTTLFNKKFNIDAGFNVSVDVHNETKVYVFPNIKVKYSLFNDMFIPYVGITGGIKQQSLREITRVNEFVIPQVHLVNEKTPYSISGGIKGSLSNSISFNTSFEFCRINDKLLFTLDSSNIISQEYPSKYTLHYDSLTRTKIEGSISYQMSEKLKLDGIGRFYSYELLNNTYAWNLPQLEFIARGSYNLFDKFLINLDVLVQGGRKALVFNEDQTTFIEDGQIVKPLGTLFDINLGAEYRYNKRISGFIQLNNAAAQRYLRWHNYPVQGFQIIGGIKARL